MKKQLALLALTVGLGVLGFTAASVAVAATQTPPGTPPGQGECAHGNSGKPCRDDPQPGNGKDCQEHGNKGGVNEDHCAGPVETTTEETTTQGTTTQETTTQGTTTTQVTTTEAPGGQTTPTVTPTLDAGSTTSTETETSTSTSKGADDSTGESSTGRTRSSAASSAGKAAVAPTKHAVLGASAVAPKPTRQAQEPPFTL